MHSGTPHFGSHPDLDYAILFDNGSVALYFSNTAKELAPNLEAAQARVGELKPYKKGEAIPGRAKTTMPERLSISEAAYRLLVPSAYAEPEPATLPAPEPPTPAVPASEPDPAVPEPDPLGLADKGPRRHRT